MPLMSLDDVKNKAPDRTAFTAAKKIANPTNWDKLGQDGNILWGVATGSKGDTYYTYADVGSSELECSCPSRKRPCKHALALLILDASGHQMPTEPMPYSHRYNAKDRYASSWE
jgi:uncharacterized Zn finger protein